MSTPNDPTPTTPPADPTHDTVTTPAVDPTTGYRVPAAATPEPATGPLHAAGGDGPPTAPGAWTTAAAPAPQPAGASAAWFRQPWGVAALVLAGVFALGLSFVAGFATRSALDRAFVRGDLISERLDQDGPGQRGPGMGPGGMGPGAGMPRGDRDGYGYGYGDRDGDGRPGGGPAAPAPQATPTPSPTVSG